MSESQFDCYVGIKACGCMVAVVVADPKYKKLTAKSIGEFIHSGYRVEPKVLDEIRSNLGPCKCSK